MSVTGYEDIPPEIRDIIMCLAHAYDETWALFLAVTCRSERARYTRIIAREEQITFRLVALLVGDYEGTMVYSRHIDGPLLPGERGYAYWRQRANRIRVDIDRKALVRPMTRAKDKAKREERQRQERQWKKRIFDE